MIMTPMYLAALLLAPLAAYLVGAVTIAILQKSSNMPIAETSVSQ